MLKPPFITTAPAAALSLTRFGSLTFDQDTVTSRCMLRMTGVKRLVADRLVDADNQMN